MEINFYQEAKELFLYSQKLRRDFHAHPEIGFEEIRTSRIVAEELEKLGIPFTHGVAKTGVVGLIEGAAPGPVVLLRFDMDALPITEETGAEYASTNPGVMHACGHDGHTAIGLTVATILKKYCEKITGTVKLVFQPAEEGLGGAKAMVDAGVLKDPKPDYSLAMHVWNDRPVGQIMVKPGPVMAGAEMFTLKVVGKGAHGAAPHLGYDPILASAQIISAVQSIVSRNVDPLLTAVVSITAINGGTAFNVIPPEVEMKGTIRTFLPEVRELVHRRLKELVDGVAEAFECKAELEVIDVTPPVINDEKLASMVHGVVSETLPKAVLVTDLQTMGSEDMAYMMDDIPGCFIFVGSKNEGKEFVYGHHHPKFDFDEDAMIDGVALITASAMKLLSSD